MPKNLTLKNIPDDLYVRLKQSAVLHGRSLNSEAIVCLKAALALRISPFERLVRARAFRAMLPKKKYSIRSIELDKRKGRQ